VLENKSLSEKIKKLRMKMNMSQDRFGKKVGVSGKTVSAYERGVCTPPLKVLEKISTAYDASFTSMNLATKDDLSKKVSYMKALICEIEERLL